MRSLPTTNMAHDTDDEPEQASFACLPRRLNGSRSDHDPPDREEYPPRVARRVCRPVDNEVLCPPIATRFRRACVPIGAQANFQRPEVSPVRGAAALRRDSRLGQWSSCWQDEPGEARDASRFGLTHPKGRPGTGTEPPAGLSVPRDAGARTLPASRPSASRPPGRPPAGRAAVAAEPAGGWSRRVPVD